MQTPSPSSISCKRRYCKLCLRPKRTCICAWIRPTENKVEVLFLQHPLEVDNAKGSARLLHLGLASSQIVIGEVFEEATLRALLYAPYPEHQDSTKTIVPILLYPDTLEDDKVAIPRVLIADTDKSAIQYRLVVIDGTWRKSRKMIYLNPLLQQLHRLPLNDPPASHYRMRKAHKSNQLSSYEACCYALMHLENEAEKYLPLLTAFDNFVEQISGYNPNLTKNDRQT